MPLDGTVSEANLRSVGLKNSKFSRLAGAAPRAGAALRLEAGAARISVCHVFLFRFMGIALTAEKSKKRPRASGGITEYRAPSSALSCYVCKTEYGTRGTRARSDTIYTPLNALSYLYRYMRR